MASLEERQREILEDVAAGRLSPAEAAERLAHLEAEQAPPRGAQEGPAAGGGVRKVRVQVAGFPVRVFGDPRIKEAVAEGPYAVHREGDTLVVTAESDGGVGGRAFAFASVGHGHWSRHDRAWRSPQPLTVRMHPDLALAAEVTASSFWVRDVRGPLQLTVSAGGVKISGFASPIDLDVTAGGLSASGVLDRGESRVRCSAGSAKLFLERGSSVRVRGMASAGRIVLPQGRQTTATKRAAGLWVDQQLETVVGDGAGELDIEVTTGNVVVRSET